MIQYNVVDYDILDYITLEIDWPFSLQTLNYKGIMAYKHQLVITVGANYKSSATPGAEHWLNDQLRLLKPDSNSSQVLPALSGTIPADRSYVCI